MIRNQFGRRNLSNYQRSVLALELEHIFKAKAKENQAWRRNNTFGSFGPKVESSVEVSKIANVGKNTIKQVKKQPRIGEGLHTMHTIKKGHTNQCGLTKIIMQTYPLIPPD